MTRATAPRASRLWFLIVVLAACLAAGRSTVSAGALAQQAAGELPGGSWSRLPGGSRWGAVWTGMEVIVYDGTPQGWDRYDLESKTWRHVSEQGAPALDRESATAVWTGRELLAWDGVLSGAGARYDPQSDTWQAISTVGAPSTPRKLATAGWTGRELLVWGGGRETYGGYLTDGAAYDPTTDRWRPLDTVGAPEPRTQAVGVWSGQELFVLGGHPPGGGYLYTAAAYNPASDTWRTIADCPAQLTKGNQAVVWTGSELLIWSVYGPNGHPGLRYGPAADTWREIPIPPDPQRQLFGGESGVWTGQEFLAVVDRGCCRHAPADPDVWVRFDPATSTWSAPVALPQASGLSKAIGWTGKELLVWREYDLLRLDPASGGAQVTAAVMEAPLPRGGHSLTWTGHGLVVWGGRQRNRELLSDGGRYDPRDGAWHALPASDAPSPRADHSATWIGREMLVWGGRGCGGVCGDGAALDLDGSRWSPLPTDGAPSARAGHSAVWTGRELIVWGGDDGKKVLADGARFDPATGVWQPLATKDAPLARTRHQAVWTGTSMVVWGGQGDSSQSYDRLNGGAAYDPASDTWMPLPSSRLSGRGYSASVTWTGSDLIMTYPNAQYVQAGSRLDLTTGRWSLLAITGRPTVSRANAMTTWTGRLLLLWGGLSSQKYFSFEGGGAAYDPVTARWWRLPVPPIANGPAVWNGQELYDWGGGPDAWLGNVAGAGFRYRPPEHVDVEQRVAGPLVHDERYVAATGFRLDDDAIWAFVQQLDGGLSTVGLPLTRPFRLWGCQVQLFELRAVQACPGQERTLLNLLDDVFPIRHVDGRLLPAVGRELKARAPSGSGSGYLQWPVFVRANVPDMFDGLPIGFQQTYFASASTEERAIQLWGLPVSAPERDPTRDGVVYQRFQRALMEYDAQAGTTRAYPIGRALRDVLLDVPGLSSDTREELAVSGPYGQVSPYFAQYCPLAPAAVCRPYWLWQTDLTFAFEPG